MPARVEYRLGSIFDEACDILVIPSSAGGTVSPGIQTQVREAGLPFPPAQMLGGMLMINSANPKYGAIAFAAAVGGRTSSPDVVEVIGLQLGRKSQAGAHRISVPLLGAGSGDLGPADSVTALERGFLSAPPHSGSVLTINIRRPEVLAELMRVHRLPLRDAGTTIPGTIANAGVHSGNSGASRFQLHGVPVGLVANMAPGVRVPVKPPERTRVFISYSHEDAEWLQRLQKHLAPLERDGALIWDDTRIKAGAQWREEIREALRQTRVAVLLISADFMASPFIVTEELPPLLAAAQDEGAVILPVIISASSFTRTPSLSRFQAVNDPEKPLVQLRRGNREKVLDKVASAVADALKSIA